MDNFTKEKLFFEDNKFLSEKEISHYNSLVSDSSFPWFLHKNTSTGYDHVLSGEEEDSMLVHTAYLNGIPNSDFYLTFKEIFDKFCLKNKISYRSILRVRLNLFFSKQNPLPTGAHVDFPFDHRVFLYYFDNSDGDTIFYNEVAVNDQRSPSKKLQKSDISSPCRGKGIIFDGKRFHSPTPPKNTRFRITLNIDFI